jgi:hypothetical protein
MGDCEDGACCKFGSDRFLYQSVRSVGKHETQIGVQAGINGEWDDSRIVHIRRGFVQDQNPVLAQNGPSNANELSLADAEISPTLVNLGNDQSNKIQMKRGTT